MYLRSILRLLILFCFTNNSFGQTYDCKVFKLEEGSAKTLYQVVYKVEKDDKFLYEGKSYFDGGISIPVVKKGNYKILLSYPGFKDTTITFSSKITEKKKPSFDSIFLSKNGMRLMGRVIDATQDLPIKDAVLILRNVMTRAEYVVKTTLAGDYNFKLDFETNYQLRVDKYSPGIINQFQDTSFYISTIGFNLPLDFKLDIFLPKARAYTTPRNISYNFDTTNLKPVLTLQKSPEFLAKDSLKNAAQDVFASTSNVQKVQAESPKIQQEAKAKEPEVLTKQEQLKKIEAELAQIRLERKQEEEKKAEKLAAKNQKREKKNRLKEVKIKPSSIDSVDLKEKQILEARKRIEEQNKLLYEKKKRETYETTQGELIAYYERKIKNSPSSTDISPSKNDEKLITKIESKVDINTIAGRGKVLLFGKVYNASNQLRLPNVVVTVRPINSIFSKEVSTDNTGRFEVEIDSAMIFVVSFFKDEFKISKQIVDLAEKRVKSYDLQDIYLTEDIDVEITKEMPVLFFDKNKSDLTESVEEELNALAVLLNGNKNYIIKLIGLAAVDETFTKPLSTSRVSQVAQYLVSMGVSQSQVKFTALGDTKRRSSCGFSKPCTSQDYNNDRVVVYIINQ